MVKMCLVNERFFLYTYYKNYADVVPIYKNTNIIGKLIRKYLIKCKCPLVSYFWTEEFKNLKVNSNDTIILFDSSITIIAANYFKRTHPDCRIIYWFWNHIYNYKLYLDLEDTIEKWSYDRLDCEKYNMRYNTQFYFKELVVHNLNDNKYESDVFFIGGDKGRIELIKDFEKIAEKYNLNTKLYVVGYNRKKSLPYTEVAKYIIGCKCILDMLPPAQKGMTLRPLEALFYRKKLITNDSNITNEDFYSKTNIFRFGVDDNSSLRNFILSPYDDSVSDSISYYNIDSWLNRFIDIN